MCSNVGPQAVNSANPKARQSSTIESHEGLLTEIELGLAIHDPWASRALVANPATVETERHSDGKLHASDEVIVGLARIEYDKL